MGDSGAGRGGRNVALERFAVSITAFTIVGHLWLGFEQSPLQPVVAVLAAYATQILIEVAEAWRDGRELRFTGGLRSFVTFLLSAHISGLSVAMLLYANERLLPMAFASAVAIGSKAIFRAPVGGGSRHYFNPSNMGVAAILLLFPWVGVVPPYQFTEGLAGGADWALAVGLFAAGSAFNHRFTGKMPMIAAWLVGFALQAVVRAAAFGTPVAAGLAPMTGVIFVLFTFYMITDPATTPSSTGGQVAFGLGVAAAYGLLMVLHVVFAIFFALTVVCAVRGAWLHVSSAAPVPTGAEVRERLAAVVSAPGGSRAGAGSGTRVAEGSSRVPEAEE